MRIAWSDSLATGVAEIDAQHRELLGHAGRVLAAIEGDPGSVGRLLDLLGDYAVSHFDGEERLMEQHGYPGTEPHREAHAAFVRTFGRIRYDYDLDGLTEGMTDLLSGWMVDWLVGHIRELDGTLGSWLVARGQADSVAQQGTWVVPSGSQLRVLSVTPGRGLDRAGVVTGDLIVAVGGRRVSDLGHAEAARVLAAAGAGGLTLTVHPGGDRARIETRFLPRRGQPARPPGG